MHNDCVPFVSLESTLNQFYWGTLLAEVSLFILFSTFFLQGVQDGTDGSFHNHPVR